ncbi:MAG: CDP-alcohol phosphatidyltransferase family protein [Anaerolineae bacterium]|nr:CDP-alcohol phosphatidyltransferase family protein [Anaerolineae bacterium]
MNRKLVKRDFPTKTTFSQRVRRLSAGLLTTTGRVLHRSGVHPDALTLAGLGMVALASLFLAQGDWLLAWTILLLGLPLDALDGATARARGPARPFGAFLDSTLDRYADALMLGSLALHYAQTGALWLVGLAIVALHGALTVSYTRARAEGLGIACEVGWFSRLERLAVLLIALPLNALDERSLNVALIILAVGTQITALQRILYVAKVSHQPEELQAP